MIGHVLCIADSSTVFTSVNKLRKANSKAYDHRWETGGHEHISKECQVHILSPVHVQKQWGASERPRRARGHIRGLSHRQFLSVLFLYLWEHCCFSMSKGSQNSNDLIPTIIFTLTKGQTSLKTVTGRICSVLFKRADTLQIGVSLMWLEPSELELYTVGH